MAYSIALWLGVKSMVQQTFFQELLAQGAAEAIAMRSRTGRKIVGYVGAGVPVELILAAGLIPFRVGAFDPSTQAVDAHLEIGDSEIVGVLANALLPFYSTKRAGSGLGLALAREIAEAHGGRVQLSNRRDGGLAVALVLPQGEHGASPRPESV